MRKISIFISIIASLILSPTIYAQHYVKDIIVTSKDGIWTDARAFSSLSAAVTAIGSDQRNLVIANEQAVTTLTIPSNITLVFERDGSINNSGNLTINTTNILAGNSQIFTGSGDIDFADSSIIHLSWFANLDYALTCLTDDTPDITLLIDKSENLTTQTAGAWTVPDNTRLTSISPGGIITTDATHTLIYASGSYSPGPEVTWQIFSGAGVSFEKESVEEINIAWWGAVPDGLTEAATAINYALGSIHYAITENGNISIRVPPPVTYDGFYKISSTIDFSGMMNFKFYCPVSIGYNQTSDATLFKWYGSEDDIAFLVSNSQWGEFLNITLDGRDVAGLVGFSFGRQGDGADTVHWMDLNKCMALQCDVGIRCGDSLTSNPDVMGIKLNSVMLWKNKSIGLEICSGNALVTADNLTAFSNGYAPYNGQYGANIVNQVGFLTITHYVSDTDSGYDPPDTADIRQYAGGLIINGAWSEVHAPFLIQTGTVNDRLPLILSGVAHYDAQMTRANTPTSITYIGGATLNLIGCNFYGDVSATAGVSGHIVDQGTIFRNTQAGFIGNAIASYGAYIGLDSWSHAKQATSSGIVIGSPTTRARIFNSTIPALQVNGNILGFMSAAPTAGYSKKGDIMINSGAASGQPWARQCTVSSTEAQGTITLTGVPVADETFVVDGITFTWKASRTGFGEVAIGVDAPACVTNIVAAITADMVTVTAVDGAGDTVVVTAVQAGTFGNSKVFTESCTNMSMDGAGTMSGTTTGTIGTWTNLTNVP